MSTVAKQASDIVRCLDGVVQAFETASIGSEDYRDKAMLVHHNVCALAQLHPNWSEERRIILRQTKDGAPPLDKSDPSKLIYEYSEQLFRAWHYMKVPRPSVRALSNGGAVFRDALVKLHLECSELTEIVTCEQGEHQVVTEAQPPLQ